jgi:threonine dehydrogenase-like Zn-dependent dehydrogenase
MTEYFIDDADYIVRIPEGLKDVGVLLEPLTIAIKGVTQAYEIQRRLHLWRPRRAAVCGCGPLGLLATLVLRLRGLQVTTFGLNQKPYLNAEYVEALGAKYQVATERSLLQVAKEDGGFDIIFEATGFSPMAFEGMQAVAKDGVLVLSSVTGGNRTCEVPCDKINLEFVLGNKVMVGTVNANREYFEMGVSDMALSQVTFPGWLNRFLTHPVDGLDNYEQLYANLLQSQGVIKTFLNVAKN